MTDAPVSPVPAGTASIRLVFRVLIPLAVLALGASPLAAEAASRSGRKTAVRTGWAPAVTAAIHPGVQTHTNNGQCTANFVYTSGSTVYIGQAAHCSGTGGSTETNGCMAKSLPEGTPVTVGGAKNPGTMVYNSWVRMQKAGETDPDTCAYNDLALVQLDPADAANVNPSVPRWGGPVGVNSAGLTSGQQIFSYGNSSLRFGITLLSPKTGISLGDQGSGWSHGTTLILPGVPGDSGSALLDSAGRATGVLSTIEIAPTPGSNNFGDVYKEVQYANAHGMAVALATGTEKFNGGQLPLG